MIISRKGAMGDMIMMTSSIREYKIQHPEEFIGVQTLCEHVFSNNPYVDVASKIISNPREKVLVLDALYENDLDRHPTDVYGEAILGTTDFNKRIELFPTERERLEVDAWWNQKIGNVEPVAICHYGLTWVKLEAPVLDNLMRWLIEHFAKVILVGQPVAAEYYPKCVDGFISLVGSQWSIQKLHWLIQKADLFFGTDTGIMHVAGTTSTPIVACFSFVNPKYREPYRPGIPFVSVATEVCETPFCAEKLKKRHPSGDFAGPKCTDFRCAKAITTKMIVDSIEKAMGDFNEQQKQDERAEEEEEGQRQDS